MSYPGSVAHVRERWEAVTRDLERTAKSVTKVTNLQVAHHLLRSCLDACKVNHLLRATHTYAVQEALDRCDDVIAAAFEDIVGLGLSPTQRDQAALPITAGGCVFGGSPGGPD